MGTNGREENSSIPVQPTRSEMRSNGTVGKRLLNVEEAAEYLGLRVDTVYKKARLRELPYVKVGRALRFDVQALERYVEQHTIETID
jgi:excisionase family DNA binding protein